MYNELTTPAVIVDFDIAEANISYPAWLLGCVQRASGIDPNRRGIAPNWKTTRE